MSLMRPDLRTHSYEDFNPLLSETVASGLTNAVEEMKEKRWSHRTVKTKMCCTIGPKTNNVESIKELLQKGMEIARLNFSHGNRTTHKLAMENIRKASKETGKLCALMMDTRGAEIRLGEILGGELTVEEGQTFTLHVNYLIGDQHSACINNYFELTKYVTAGDRIYIDYGVVSLTVESVTRFQIKTTVDNTGPISSNKIITIRGKKPNLDKPFMNFQDTKDIDFAVRNDFDFIAASYVNKPRDILDIKGLPGVAESGIKIIAKIETKHASDNIDHIIEVSDGIYLSRSDLAVEVEVEYMTNIQKQIAHRCNCFGVPCVVATQVLHSMAKNPRPTRAECTDIANSILEGYDCIVLTNATTGSPYSIEAQERLSSQCREVEKDIGYRALYSGIRRFNTEDISVSESVASSAVKTAWDCDAQLILVLCNNSAIHGFVSKYRPHTPILCVADDVKVARRVLLSRGCIPLMVDDLKDPGVVKIAIKKAKDMGLIFKGENSIVIEGSDSDVTAFRVEKIE